jgi:phage gp37-like protein
VKHHECFWLRPLRHGGLCVAFDRFGNFGDSTKARSRLARTVGCILLASNTADIHTLYAWRIFISAHHPPKLDGLVMIGSIENAIIAMLRAASDRDVLGYKYDTLESYPADWDAYMKESSGIIKAPAAWVVYNGWREVPSDCRSPQYDMRFYLIVMAENQRNENYRRTGDPVNPKTPGSYQMIWDAAALLSGQNLGLDIGALKVGGCRFVTPPSAMKDRKISMLAIELSSIVPGADPVTYNPDIKDFAAVHIDWDLPPFGGVDAESSTPGIQLPDPAHAAASDDIILETAP